MTYKLLLSFTVAHIFVSIHACAFAAAQKPNLSAIKVGPHSVFYSIQFKSKTLTCLKLTKKAKEIVYAGKIQRRRWFFRFNEKSIARIRGEASRARAGGSRRGILLSRIKKLSKARREADRQCLNVPGASSSSSSQPSSGDAAIPRINGVAPQRGPLAGGTAVEISGEHLTSDTAISFGGAPLRDTVFVDTQHMRGHTPPASIAGYVDVLATNAIGSAVLPLGFAYVADSALTAEICANGRDDDGDGSVDEAPCETVDSYLTDWKFTGAVVDWVAFGNYPLYLETQVGRNVTMDTWGQACVGQTGLQKSPDEERDRYCIGRAPNFLEWDMTVPAQGNYVLTLGDLWSGQNHELYVDRGAGWERLPNIVGAQGVGILKHYVGPYPSQIFYLLHLKAGLNRFRIANGGSFFFVTSAVLAEPMKQNHSFENATHPHLHFKQADIDSIIGRRQAGTLSQEQRDLLQTLKDEADNALGITDFPALGRDRQGVLESLTYSGVLNQNTAHLAKAKELFLQEARWLQQMDGDYRDGDILMYGYDMRQAGTVVDLLESSFTSAERQEIHEILMIEAQRHALSNLAGQWWRFPEAGGWTSSHGQGGQLGLALYFTDELAKFYFDVSLLMMKTTLRDNIKIDGSYLQALGTYYGWDIRTMIYFTHAITRNPEVSAENLFEFGNRALQRYIHFMTYALGSTRLCMGPFGTENCASGFYGEMGSVLLPAADYYQDASIRWLFENTVGSSRKAYRIGRYLPEALLWLDSAVHPATPETVLPLGKNYREHDHAFMRTGWADNDVAYMSRCGLSANHSQKEHGSFILYADGYNYLQTYNGYDASEPWLQTEYKNLILIDGKGQGDPGTSMTSRMGQIDHFIHSSSVDYSLCDNSYGYNLNPSDPTSQPVDYSTRKVIFVRPSATRGGYFVMLDASKAQGTSAHRYEFALHPGCERVNNGCVNPIQATYENGQGFALHPAGTNSNLKVRFVEPAPADMSYSILPMPGDGNFPSYIKVSKTNLTQNGYFMAVLFPEAPDEQRLLPSLTRLAPASGQIGMQLGADTMIWSKDGTAINANGILSDGKVAFARNENGLSLAFALEGTYVEALGHRLSSSLATNLTLRKEGQTYAINVGDSAVDAKIGAVTISLSGLSASYTLIVDGQNQGIVTAQNGVVSFPLTISTVHEVSLVGS